MNNNNNNNNDNDDKILKSKKIDLGNVFVIYTDGSCLKNPNGPGGFSSYIISKNNVISISGGEHSTTNNRMEMRAVIESLNYLNNYLISNNYKDNNITIDLYSDSQYVLNAYKKFWIKSWKKNNWKTKDGNDVKNIDLWIQLDKFFTKFTINLKWCRGHSGNKYNEFCDKLAKDEAIKRNKEIVNLKDIDKLSRINIKYFPADTNIILPTIVKKTFVDVKTFSNKNINEKCKSNINKLNHIINPSFSLLAELKVGGRDYLSNMNYQELIQGVNRFDLKKIKDSNLTDKYIDVALRWLKRGLKIELAIKKAKIEKELEY